MTRPDRGARGRRINAFFIIFIIASICEFQSARRRAVATPPNIVYYDSDTRLQPILTEMPPYINAAREH